MTLNWQHLQEKWQQAWHDAQLGKASIKKGKDKFFMIFAYPGISGYLHVGHMRGFSYTDAICRYERLKGKEVLFPVGTHASGNQAIAFAKKVKNNDETWITYLKNNGCSNTTIAELTDADKVVQYFNQVYVEDYWKKFGFLCDWERFTCTIFSDYEKFIQWQFKKLFKKDLLVQKPYFAAACPDHGPVAVDPSETDISKGGNAEKVEYTLLKFKIGNEYLVAATLRPETVFGQTNLWVNPAAKHVRVEVQKEDWIVSKEAAEKLKYQKDNVIIKENVDISTYIGKKALAPGADREIIILPAPFCDPKIGTGIVTSVPSHAPYDWIALEDLKKNRSECEKYKLDHQEILNIQPIPLIRMEGWDTHPAQQICQQMGIYNQQQTDKLEDAKKEIYKEEHHTGIMLEISGKFAGKKVEEAKEMVKAKLLGNGQADVFHDLSEEVICRCGQQVSIKRIDDQWFIKYSDPELTERSKEQAKEMNIYPQEYYDSLPKVLEWFSDRACARLGNWLGSKLPFDSKWTVEPISDSTLYPAYYIVSKFINNKTLTTADLTEDFFDYVFLHKGKPQDSWKQVREEFDYFYPLDINLGGKEHQTVHFPVFLMNHVAILPEEKWPKGILVNWWVTGKGSKISKSKGGAEPIPQAIEKYGVDAMRLYYAHIGSPHVDVVWDEEIVLNYKNALERIYSLVQELKVTPVSQASQSNPAKKKTTHLDRWLESCLHQRLRTINNAMKQYELRELASIVYFSIYDDLKWYLRRGGENRTITRWVIKQWCILMNPITPHLSEELNPYAAKDTNNINDINDINNINNMLISCEHWPETEQSAIDLKAQAGEELVQSTISSMRNVLKLANLPKPTQWTFFIAEKWLYPLAAMLHKELQVTRNMGEIMKKVLEQEEFKEKGKDISRIVSAVIKDPVKVANSLLSQEEETAILNDASSFLEKEFNCPVKIILGDESDHPKAKAAWPGKVGILVE